MKEPYERLFNFLPCGLDGEELQWDSGSEVDFGGRDVGACEVEARISRTSRGLHHLKACA